MGLIELICWHFSELLSLSAGASLLTLPVKVDVNDDKENRKKIFMHQNNPITGTGEVISTEM